MCRRAPVYSVAIVEAATIVSVPVCRRSLREARHFVKAHARIADGCRQAVVLRHPLPRGLKRAIARNRSR